MTDDECTKICKILDLATLFLNDDGIMCAVFNDSSSGHLYIYEDSFSSALPLRILVHGKRELSTKTLLEYLFKQSADGISTMIAGLAKNGKLDKSKFITKDDTIESFLVKYDLMHSHKKSRKRKIRKS